MIASFLATVFYLTVHGVHGGCEGCGDNREEDRAMKHVTDQGLKHATRA